MPLIYNLDLMAYNGLILDEGFKQKGAIHINQIVFNV